MKKPNEFFTRSKIWLEDPKGKVVFGLGRYRILKAIQEAGSLNAAAKELKMGYRAIWARIHATEERLGMDLVVKKKGGARGGGSQLTPLALDLIRRFEGVRSYVEEKTDIMFEKDFGDHLNINPRENPHGRND